MTPKPSFRYDPEEGVEPLFESDDEAGEIPDLLVATARWFDRQDIVFQAIFIVPFTLLVMLWPWARAVREVIRA